jgi:hypothetical protein
VLEREVDIRQEFLQAVKSFWVFSGVFNNFHEFSGLLEYFKLLRIIISVEFFGVLEILRSLKEF